jgi:hypothetical protein
MYRNFVSKLPLKLCAAVACSAVVYKNFSDIDLKPLQAGGINVSRKYYPASAEYPDLTKNRNIMARNMNKQLYAKLRDRFTYNGFTIDDAIQTGVDNVGKFSFTGIVAGDEQSYHVIRAKNYWQQQKVFFLTISIQFNFSNLRFDPRIIQI